MILRTARTTDGQVLQWEMACTGPIDTPLAIHQAEVAAGFGLPVERVVIEEREVTEQECLAYRAMLARTADIKARPSPQAEPRDLALERLDAAVSLDDVKALLRDRAFVRELLR